jgi:hypothetical protein
MKLAMFAAWLAVIAFLVTLALAPIPNYSGYPPPTAGANRP